MLVTNYFNTNDHKCVAIICDNFYKDVFKKRFLNTIGKILSYYMVKIHIISALLNRAFALIQTFVFHFNYSKILRCV